MGKYDDAIGGGKLILDVEEVLNEEAAKKVDDKIKKQKVELSKPIELTVKSDAAVKKLESLTKAATKVKEQLQEAMSTGKEFKDLYKIVSQYKTLCEQIKKIAPAVDKNNTALKEGNKVLQDTKKLVDQLMGVEKKPRATKQKTAVKQELVETEQLKDAVKEVAVEREKSVEKSLRTQKQVAAELEKEMKLLKEIEKQQEKNDAARERFKRKQANYGEEVLGVKHPVYDIDLLKGAKKELDAFNESLATRNKYQEKYNALCRIVDKYYVSDYGVGNGIYKDLDKFIELNLTMKKLDILFKSGQKTTNKYTNGLFNDVIRSLRSEISTVSGLLSSGEVSGALVGQDLSREETQLNRETQRLLEERETQLKKIDRLREEEVDLIKQAGQEEVKAANKIKKSPKEIKQSTDAIKSLGDAQEKLIDASKLQSNNNKTAKSIGELEKRYFSIIGTVEKYLQLMEKLKELSGNNSRDLRKQVIDFANAMPQDVAGMLGERFVQQLTNGFKGVSTKDIVKTIITPSNANVFGALQHKLDLAKSIDFNNIKYADDGSIKLSDSDNPFEFLKNIEGQLPIVNELYEVLNNIAMVKKELSANDTAKVIEQEVKATEQLAAAQKATFQVGDIREVPQEFTSAKTSINSKKLPAIFSMIHLEPDTVNIDYGGGRFDNATDYLAQQKVHNFVYDPYNRTSEHNNEVLNTLSKNGGADTATLSNVLNVIKEQEARNNVLQNLAKLTKPGGKIYITVYEGTGKGNEGATSSGYQLNRKTEDYLEEVRSVFPDAVRHGKLIVATNNGQSVGDSTISLGKERELASAVQETTQSREQEAAATEKATKAKIKYYEIDEKAAKISKQNRSFDDYKEGSATASYKAAVDEMAKIVEEKKKQFPDKADKLDTLLDKYAKNLATYLNRDNQIGAQYPSVMISGAGNYNIKKHNKQLASWGKNYQFYEDSVVAIENQIRTLGGGAEVIRGDEENALEKLESKVEYMKYWHQVMVEVNKYYRKNKTLEGFEGAEPDELERIKKALVEMKRLGMSDVPYPQYALTNDNQNIKRLEGRIAELKRLKTEGGKSDALSEENNIYKLWVDKKDMRIRISFEMGKPDREIVDILKGKAFKWSPKNNAWQRQLTDNAVYAAKRLQESLHEFYGITPKIDKESQPLTIDTKKESLNIEQIEIAYENAANQVRNLRNALDSANKELEKMQKNAELYGYTMNMSAKNAGRTQQILAKNNRSQYVVNMLKSGYPTIQTSSKEYGFDRSDLGKNVFTHITKTEYEFAQYLSNKIKELNIGWDEGLKILASQNGQLDVAIKKVAQLEAELSAAEKQSEIAYENMVIAHNNANRKNMPKSSTTVPQFEQPDGQLSFFETIAESAEKATESTKNLKQEMQNVKLDGEQLTLDDLINSEEQVVQAVKKVTEAKKEQVQVASEVTAQVEAQANAEERVTQAANEMAQSLNNISDVSNNISDVSFKELINRDIDNALARLRSAKNNKTTLIDLNGVFNGNDLIGQARSMIDEIAKQANLSLGKFNVSDDTISVQLYNEALKITVNQIYRLKEATEEMESAQLELVRQSFGQDVKTLNKNNFDVEGVQKKALAAIEKVRSSLHGLEYDLTDLTTIANNISSQDDFTKFNNQLKATQDNIQAIKNSTVSKNSMNPLANMKRDMQNSSTEIDTMRLKLEALGDVKGITEARSMLNDMTKAVKEYNAAQDAQSQQKAYNQYSNLRSSFEAQLKYINEAKRQQAKIDKAWKDEFQNNYKYTGGKTADDQTILNSMSEFYRQEEEKANQFNNNIKSIYDRLVATVKEINSLDTKMNSLSFQDNGSGLYAKTISSLQSRKSELVADLRSLTDEINNALSLNPSSEESGLSQFFKDTRVQAVLTSEEIQKFDSLLRASNEIEFNFGAKFTAQIQPIVDKITSLKKMIAGGFIDKNGDITKNVLSIDSALKGKLKNFTDNPTAFNAIDVMKYVKDISTYIETLDKASQAEARYFSGKTKYSQATTMGNMAEQASEEAKKVIEIQKQLEDAAKSFAKESGASGAFVTNFTQSADGISKLDFSIFDTATNSLRNFRMEMGNVTDGMYITETTVNKSLANIQAAQKQIQSMSNLLATLGNSGININPDTATGQVSKLLQLIKQLQTETAKGDNADQGLLAKLTKDAKLTTSEVEKLYKQMMKMNEALLSNGSVKYGGTINLNGDKYAQMTDQIQKFAAQFPNATLRVGQLNEETGKLPFTLTNVNGKMTTFEAQLSALNGKMTIQEKGVKQVNTAWSQFGSMLKSTGKRLLTALVGYNVFFKVISEVRKGINYVKEIDLAMTELKKVTDETTESYAKFLDSAASTSAKIGSTVSEFTEATANFARLGYSMEESAKMAESAVIYKNVADGLDTIEESTASIISTMKAFGIESNDTMGIIDRFNEVGNNFAITSAGIGEALQRSASALYEAGNSIDESIGLVTAANSVVQNPEQVGEMLADYKVA